MTMHRLKKTLWALLTIGALLTGRIALASDTPNVAATLLLAQNGDADAQYAMGLLHGQGHGVEEDLKQAAFWYLRAAMGGHAEAQYQLGLMHDSGTGIPQDYTQTLTWHGKAAKQGHPEAQAQCAMGDLYAKGNGVPMTTSRLLPGTAKPQSRDRQLANSNWD